MFFAGGFRWLCIDCFLHCASPCVVVMMIPSKQRKFAFTNLDILPSSVSSILFDLILRSSTKFLREHDDLLLLECLKKISSYLSRCISITLPDHPTCILPFKHGLEAPGVKEYLKTNRRLGPKGFNSQPLKGGDDCFFMFVYHIAKMEQICVYIY